MDGPIPAPPAAASPAGKPERDEAAGGLADPAALQVELSTITASVEEAAREWGLRSDSREGKFVSAFLGTVSWLSRLSVSAHAGQQALSREQREAAATDLARVQEITRAANISLSQARNALIGLEVERENAIVRMIHETLPVFAERLQGALIIREKSWNEGQRFKRYALVATVTLGLVVGGYGWRAWQDTGATTVLDRCLSHAVEGNGRIYCDVTGFVAVSK